MTHYGVFLCMIVFIGLLLQIVTERLSLLSAIDSITLKLLILNLLIITDLPKFTKFLFNLNLIWLNGSRTIDEVEQTVLVFESRVLISTLPPLQQS